MTPFFMGMPNPRGLWSLRDQDHNLIKSFHSKMHLLFLLLTTKSILDIYPVTLCLNVTSGYDIQGYGMPQSFILEVTTYRVMLKSPPQYQSFGFSYLSILSTILIIFFNNAYLLQLFPFGNLGFRYELKNKIFCSGKSTLMHWKVSYLLTTLTGISFLTKIAIHGTAP